MEPVDGPRRACGARGATGYLTHPHTSAGRVPTDAGYRLYADTLLAAPPAPRAARGHAGPLADAPRGRRGDACDDYRALPGHRPLALATAPPASSSQVHRVEVLLLQPRVVMVMVIATNGAVTKRVYTFDEPVDSGLVEWASSYLNERLSGLALGARMTGPVLADPELGPARARVPGPDLPALHRPRAARRRGSLRRGSGASALRGARARPAACRRADARARGPRRPASACCARRSTSARRSSGSARRTRRRSCAP